MAYDAHKNFAYSTVLTAPSPASSGTSLVVQSGDGTKFPAASFNATVWPAGAQPTAANSEIVRVTVISTDTFTITRTQESTSARTIVVGDQIAATITAKTITDIEANLPAGAWSTYTVSPTGFSGTPTTVGRFTQLGKLVIMLVDIDGTSNATSFGFSLPVAAKSAIQMPARVRDAGTYGASSGLIAIAAAGTTASVFKDMTGAAFTGSGNKSITGFMLAYEAN